MLNFSTREKGPHGIRATVWDSRVNCQDIVEELDVQPTHELLTTITFHGLHGLYKYLEHECSRLLIRNSRSLQQ